MGIEATYQRHWWLILAMIAASYRLSRKKHTCVLHKAALAQAEVLKS
jgi:hypothetical protein